MTVTGLFLLMTFGMSACHLLVVCSAHVTISSRPTGSLADRRAQTGTGKGRIVINNPDNPRWRVSPHGPFPILGPEENWRRAIAKLLAVPRFRFRGETIRKNGDQIL